ncbi:hypothetical protein ACFFWD_36670 [Bradyrhizobium erythrophlei]|uniref:ATP-binding protein n=1 Tax=Bradyrhizobium erythrophlei TaxID=1437360 RepID=UPI0035E5F47D
MAEVAAMLSTTRLLTLTGVGGVGKTRLALEVAEQVASHYPDGVWLIEFAALVDSGAVGHAVAGLLGLTQRPGRSIEQSVTDALRGRHVLLLFDNCEHLIEAIASLVRQVMANCPHVTLLATSREALALDSEQAWPVSPLDVEGTASAAVRLFVERARAVAPKFPPSTDDPTITEVCRQLDGIPLAIELAAARMNAMSPSQLRERLDESFRLLGHGSRRAEKRHQTLRHTVQWSYDLLSSQERAVLARASTFAGGFMLEAAERICVDSGSVLDALDSLVRKSLVTVERSGPVVRYGMLETVRQFAEEQRNAMGEGDTARLRHAQFFADDSDAYFKIWLSPRQPEAYQWLDREIGNLRAAFRWASEHGEIDIAARIASNIGDMARFRVRDEAAHWAGEIVEAARTIRHRRLAVLLTWAASSAWSFARLEEARRHAKEAILLSSDPDFDPFAWAFADLAMVASYEGKNDEVVEYARAGADHPADRRDRFCLAMRAYFLSVAGRYTDAMVAADEDMHTVEATGVPGSIAIALWAKGKAFAETAPSVALAAYDRGFAIARQSGNSFWETMIIFEVAALQARVGDPVNALQSFQSVLSLGRRSADLMFVSHGLGNLIVLFDRLGRADAAATLNGTLSKTFEFNPFVPEQSNAVGRLRDALGTTVFEAASRRGAAMALHEAFDYAIDQVEQALAAV